MSKIIPLKRPEKTELDGYCAIPQQFVTLFHTMDAQVSSMRRVVSGSFTRTEQLALVSAQLDCIANMARMMKGQLP